MTLLNPCIVRALNVSHPPILKHIRYSLDAIKYPYLEFSLASSPESMVNFEEAQKTIKYELDTTSILPRFKVWLGTG